MVTRHPCDKCYWGEKIWGITLTVEIIHNKPSQVFEGHVGVNTVDKPVIPNAEDIDTNLQPLPMAADSLKWRIRRPLCVRYLPASRAAEVDPKKQRRAGFQREDGVSNPQSWDTFSASQRVLRSLN